MTRQVGNALRLSAAALLAGLLALSNAAASTLSTAQIAAFGATCRAQGSPEDDANIQALLSAATPVCTVVGKSSTLHVTEVLRTTLDDNLRLIQASVAYLRSIGA